MGRAIFVLKDSAVGVVDVAAAIGLRTGKFASDLKLPRHCGEIVLLIHAHNFPG